jgi:L-malate glycosyltransferase
MAQREMHLSAGRPSYGRVLVVQRRLTHYRVPLFELLRHRLADAGFDLVLAVGQPTVAEASKRDEGHVEWALPAPCTYMYGGRACWQDVRSIVRAGDLVVLTQENGLLANYRLLLQPGKARVGLWGHGRNFQANGGVAAGLAQRWKAVWSRQADWWFAYTELSARLVQGFGYPPARITVLDNAIDTGALVAAVDDARRLGRDVVRGQFGLDARGPLGVFMGSLHADKLLDLLVHSAEIVRQSAPEFQLAIAGDGPLRPWLVQRTAELPWIHLLGVRAGQEKAALLSSADCVLNPGATGLGILDAFASTLPYLTTCDAHHGPEIAYLNTGVNGLITAQGPAAFANAVLHVLCDHSLAERLARGSRQSAALYGMDRMVDRFAQGVVAWATSPRLGTRVV